MKSLFAAILTLKNNKTILSGVVILILMSTAAQAQNDTLPSMRFGMKIQPAMGWLRSDTEGIESNGSEFRFTWGGMAEFKFGERYYFATGIDVSNRGGSIRQTVTQDSLTTITDQNLKLKYIELPITLKLKTNEIGYLCYYLQFGLAPGFNFRSNADITTTTQISGNGPVTTKAEKVDVDDAINFFNLSLVIGLGAEYRFSGTTTLVGGLTYSNGFLDAASDNNVTLNTNYLGLTVGVLF